MAGSRQYKVQTAEAVGQVVVATDHVKVKVELPPVMPRERMGKLLADAFRRRGYKEDGGDGVLVRERGDGVKMRIDPATGELTVEAAAETKLPPGDPSPCGCRAAAKLKAASGAQSDLQRQVTERLKGAVSTLGCQVEAIVHEVTVAALKEKAAQLGEVTAVAEDARAGTATITVKV